MRVVGPSPIRHRRGVSGLICLSSGINHTAMWLGTSPNVNTCVHQHGKICRKTPGARDASRPHPSPQCRTGPGMALSNGMNPAHSTRATTASICQWAEPSQPPPRADGAADRIREPGTAAEFGQVTTAQQQLSRYDHAMRQQAIAEVVDEPSDAHRGKLGNQYGGKGNRRGDCPMADTARMPSFAESRM